MLRGKVEGEMVLLSEGSSAKESPEDKQASAPCARGSAKSSQQVTLALYTGCIYCPGGDCNRLPTGNNRNLSTTHHMAIYKLHLKLLNSKYYVNN